MQITMQIWWAPACQAPKAEWYSDRMVLSNSTLRRHSVTCLSPLDCVAWLLIQRAGARQCVLRKQVTVLGMA
jgi:hypothetical protein